MFKRQALPLETQLTPEQLANLIIVEAIEQLQKATQLSAKHCEQLIADQFTASSVDIAPQMNQPLIDSDEFDYIRQLF